MFPRQNNRAERRANQRLQRKQLAKAGKTGQQAAADVSKLHADGFALMWYACVCGHRERIWNSRDDVTPFCIPCPSCGASTLSHVDRSLDVVSREHTAHEGQRVFVELLRGQAEHIVARGFGRMGLTPEHPKFASTVDDLLAHTTGSTPLVAVAGDVAYYAPRVARLQEVKA